MIRVLLLCLAAFLLVLRWLWAKAQVAEDVADDFQSRQRDYAMRAAIHKRLAEHK